MTDRDEGRTLPHGPTLDILLRLKQGQIGVLSAEDELNALCRADPSGEVGEEGIERRGLISSLSNAIHGIENGTPLPDPIMLKVLQVALARLRRTPETEALKKLRYVDSPLWSHDGSCRYCAVGFYALGSEHDDGCPAGAILTMYPRTKWDEARDDATQDPNAGGEDE